MDEGGVPGGVSYKVREEEDRYVSLWTGGRVKEGSCVSYSSASCDPHEHRTSIVEPPCRASGLTGSVMIL